MIRTLLIICVMGTALIPRAETYAEKLGWKADDIVLILHVDDAGMSHG